MKRVIHWPAVASAALSVISILSASWNPELSLAAGLSAIASAVLATRG